VKIGCVTEIKKYEYRVGLTPENVSEYVLHGHEVYVQKGLGDGSAFTDSEYELHGAKVLGSADEVWAIADMIIKVKEPLEPEYKLMHKDQIVYAYMHLAADKGLTDAFLQSGASSVAYETLTDNQGRLPLLVPMSDIAGR
jgi:alanine dehydrogenase